MPNEVEQIKSRLDIVEVIGEFVKLKQSGQNWKGLCPFHGEKSPSFMVHREKQIWHCFGCGEGGDMFSFMQKFENIDFPEALELLARKAGVELAPRGSRGEAGPRQRIFQTLEVASAFYQEQLIKAATGEQARAYLKQRRVAEESVSTFGLGYALPEWDKLTNHLKQLSFNPEEAVAAGLVLKSERGPGLYDRFRNRLMFPIADSQDRVVGFGARTLDPEAKEAKYINSPQGPTYNKSLVVYNLGRAKNFIKEVGYAVVVEGYMDVIGCWQVGIKNVVATSGTAFTPEQIKLLKRYTNEIRIAFDADLAGQSASRRGIDLALEAELEVKIIQLPTGKDPDECAQADPQGLRQAVAGALPIGDYAFVTVLKSVDVSTREGKKEAARRLLQAIAKLPDPVERDYYLKRLARELSVEERSLRERLPAPTAANQAPQAAQPAAAEPIIMNRPQLLVERALALVFKHTDQAAYLFRELKPDLVPAGALRELYSRLAVFYTERHRLDPNELEAELSSSAEHRRWFDVITLQSEDEFGDLAPGVLPAELAKLVRDLKIHSYTTELKLLGTAIRQAEASGNQSDLDELLSRFAEVSHELGQLQV